MSLPQPSDSTGDLEAVLGSKASMAAILIDGYLKFQLKRKPLGQDGTSNFIKQVRKLKAGSPDDLSAAAVRYARNELETNDVFSQGWDEGPRNNVLADVVAAFVTMAKEDAAAAITATAAETDVKAVEHVG